MKNIFLVVVSFGFLTGCGSHPVLPTTKDIEVSRAEPAKACENLGLVEGRTATTAGTQEEALEDMKKDAVKKGANYVRMETIGAMGTSVRGTAFYCR